MTDPNPNQPPRKPAVGDGQDKGADVQQMFASIAPRYDLLNRVLSLGVDQTWRHTAAGVARRVRPWPKLHAACWTSPRAPATLR